MKITMNHAKNLVTRELNLYKKNNEFVPFRAEIINNCNLFTGIEVDEKGNMLLDFNDNYKTIIAKYFDSNYKELNQTINFLESYKEITLFKVAREIEKQLDSIKEEYKTEDFKQAFINSAVQSNYYKFCESLDAETLLNIYRTNKNLIIQNIDNVRKNWEEELIDQEVYFEDKIIIAIDYYMIDYLSQNIHKEIEEYKNFNTILLSQLEKGELDDYQDFTA